MNSEGYNEARALLAAALRERAPATAEAIGEVTPLSYGENACVFALACLLERIDEPNEVPPSIDEKMKLQRAEFDAADKLAVQIRRLGMTPVVDDDYPAVRHDYEGALKAYLAACKANGRKVTK